MAAAADSLEAVFGSPDELNTLAFTMYILGLAVGPLVLAPLSEYYGRNPVYIVSWGTLVIFQIPVALAPNLATVIVCRLIQGCGGSSPVTNTGGTISDVWARDSNGFAMAIYGLSSTFGPPFSLVILGYLAAVKGFRIMSWALMGITGGFWLIMLVTMPETRHSTILERKAKRVRKTLDKEGIRSDQIYDINYDGKKTLYGLFSVHLTRPFKFFFTEPITFCAAAYNV